METLRVGVLGLGMGAHHARAYHQIPGVIVAALCDVDTARLAQVAAELGVDRTTTDAAEILTDPTIDAVSIATPDHLHYEQAKLALLHGKHVLCEKPMVTSEEQALDLVDLVRRTGRTFMVGNVNRFVPQFQAIHQYIKAGRLGQLFFVESDYIHDMRLVYQRTPWRVDPKAPQNFWFGGGVHPMDLVRWLAGEVVEAFMYASRGSVPEFPLESDFICILRFANGCMGKVLATAGVRVRPEHWVSLTALGHEGTMKANTLEMQAKVYLNEGLAGQNDFATIPFTPTIGHPVRAELEHFVACIRTGRQPLVDVVDGARTIAALAAAERSLQTGRPERVRSIP